MRINRQELLTSLECVRPGLAPREIEEQSTCLIFKGGVVHTYNGEVFCRCPTPLPFEGVLGADKFMSMMSKWPDEEVDFEPTKKHWKAKAGGKKTNFLLQEEILVPLEKFPVPTRFAPLPADFPDGVSLVSRCTSRELKAGQDPHDTCIHLTPGYLEGTTGTQTGRWYAGTPVTASLVRCNAVKAACVLGVNQVAEDDSWLHLRSDRGLIFSCLKHLDEDQYPSLDEYLEGEGLPLKLPKSLLQSIDCARIASRELLDEESVLIELTADRVKLSGVGITLNFEQTKKCRWPHRDVAFRIDPQTLAEIIEKFDECLVCDNRLLVKGENYRFAVPLKQEEG